MSECGKNEAMIFKRVSDDFYCVRKECGKRRACAYMHNCKGMTGAQAVTAVADWEAASRRREEETARREHEAAMERRELSGRIEAMLAAHGISLYEFEDWLKGV